MNTIEYRISCRTFVGSLAAVLAVAWLMPPGLRAAESSVLRKTIPATGETLPVIGLGSSRTFDVVAVFKGWLGADVVG